ncbi:hypothetical protein FRY77_04340 [Halomonas sp. MG34]|nr:hypothetical protein [Halomonas sp. MG34]
MCPGRRHPASISIHSPGVSILGGSHHAHEVDLEQLNSLVEDKDMLSENLENLVQKERQEGRQEERREAEQRALESGSLSEAQLYQPTL